MAYSSLDPSLRELLDSFSDSYNEAEQAMKSTELETQEGLAFPCINELRYAGQHLIRSFKETSREKAEDCLRAGIRHARRAIYDAYDANINFYLLRCRKFQDDYKLVRISSVITGYVEDKTDLDAVVSEIAGEDRTKKDEYVNNKREQINKLRCISARWEAARDEMNKLAIEDRVKTRRHVTLVVLGLAAVVTTVVIGAGELLGVITDWLFGLSAKLNT